MADGLARAGCGSGQAWLQGPFGSRAPGTGPVVISPARSAIRSPHLGPIVRSGSGRLRGFCDTRPGSIEAPRHLRRCSDRGTTSSMAVQRGAPTGSGPLGLRLGLCALPLARSRSFRSPDVRQKVADLQGLSCDGETRTRTGDTTIFRRAQLTAGAGIALQRRRVRRRPVPQRISQTPAVAQVFGPRGRRRGPNWTMSRLAARRSSEAIRSKSLKGCSSNSCRSARRKRARRPRRRELSGKSRRSLLGHWTDGRLVAHASSAKDGRSSWSSDPPEFL